jgi:hypothetical protein
MIVHDATLSHVQATTAMAVLFPATCGAWVSALTVLRIVAWSVSLSGAMGGEHRRPSASLSIPFDPVVNPLLLMLAHHVRGTLPAVHALEVMP